LITFTKITPREIKGQNIHSKIIKFLENIKLNVYKVV
jgi:hypothetical protein